MEKPVFISNAESFSKIDPTDPSYKEFDGVVGYSDYIDAPMMEAAFHKGIFPWSEKAPYLWFFTSPRMSLIPSQFVISHSLKKRIRDAAQGFYKDGSQKFALSLYLDRNMGDVILGCAGPRKDQQGTWIGRPLARAYLNSVKDGFFHTISCIIYGEMFAGLMFDSIGRMFYGESMYTRTPDLSKVALALLVAIAKREKVGLIDCQDESEHLRSLGASPIDGRTFYQKVQAACALPPVDWSQYRDKPLNFILGDYGFSAPKTE